MLEVAGWSAEPVEARCRALDVEVVGQMPQAGGRGAELVEPVRQYVKVDVGSRSLGAKSRDAALVRAGVR